MALVVAGLPGRREPGCRRRDDDPPGTIAHLRRDDLLFIALGIVPGAVVGGRIAYVILHLDYYSAEPDRDRRPDRPGSLALSGAVILGALTGGLVARLFDAPVGRWYTLAVMPMLLVLGLGKAANVLGGTGQGLPSTADWATRYLGPGPWGSLGPDIPSVPAQAFEAIGTAVVAVVVLAVVLVARRLRRRRARDGRLFAAAARRLGDRPVRRRRDLARSGRRRAAQRRTGPRPGDHRVRPSRSTRRLVRAGRAASRLVALAEDPPLPELSWPRPGDPSPVLSRTRYPRSPTSAN